MSTTREVVLGKARMARDVIISHFSLVRSSCQTTPPLLPTYFVGKGRQSGNERSGERTRIREKRIDTLSLGSASRDTAVEER